MKSLFRCLFLAGILLLGWSFSAMALFPQQGFGTLQVKNPGVKVIRDGKEQMVGSLGLALMKKDVIQTDDKGKAQIALNTGDAIFVGPVTRLIVDESLTNQGSSSGVRHIVLSVWGKIRSQVKPDPKKKFEILTTTATIGIKGTDFIVENVDDVTTVGTLNGLVMLSSQKNQNSVDIPPGKMSSVSPLGEVMPLTEFAGRLMQDMEFAGAKMKEEESSGAKIRL
ncbi:MAG: FecR domain-containing protein [SAR324 cluster bacterium]|nr:FecR domain-containing protein [SAR324 cluster bacterium]MBF0349390.1 FecR domain-containing protein [SAR324 cluster bacterium]